ncbi:ABC transporter permease [Ruania rhizosphaerae]|uniref:ABC transporter permease n=1 Tax=Ruania rhizosphaerae TaxID=1840413 RepID=UPI001357623F|nr:ABC transporter permease [Ruania rhizosphaerae]
MTAGAEPAAVTASSAGPPRPGRRTPWWLVLPALPVALILVVAIAPGPFAGIFGNGDPRVCDLANSRADPRPGHPFGFDVQGCDLWANVVWGTRSSVLIGILVTLGVLIIAIVLGTLAAYFRRWVDMLVSRSLDIVLGFPALVGMVVVLTTIGQRNAFTVSAVLILFGWPGMTRVMRGSALAVVDRDYADAARGYGASSWRVMWRHVVPNAIAPVLVLASLAVGTMITAESALTFLGIGLQQPAISWGVQLNSAQAGFRQHLHLLLAPALFLSVTVLSFVVFGEAIRRRLDPSHQRSVR